MIELNKKNYETPVVASVEISAEDVIVTSGFAGEKDPLMTL